MLGSKLETEYYWYNDEYMYFSFNGQHSSKYHLFIQNTKDLTIENTVGAASEYSNAMMQEGTYYLGTSRKQKNFKRKCAAELNNIRDYKRMMKWLTVGTIGELVFDSDRYWGWTVVLDTVGDATFATRDGLIFVEFDITFKTIGTYLAHNIYPATWDSTNNQTYIDVIGSNKYNIPTVLAKQKTEGTTRIIDLFIQDLGNTKQDFTLSIAPTRGGITTNINLSIDKIEIVKTGETTETIITNFLLADFVKKSMPIYSLNYTSENGVLYINQNIAEEHDGCQKTVQPNGLLQFNTNEPMELYTTSIQYNDKTIIINLDEDSWYEFIGNNYSYVTVSKQNQEHTLYSVDEFGASDEYTYTADKDSYTGLVNTLYDAGISANVGKYEINTNNKQIILTFANALDIDINNTYVVHCGKTNHIRATLKNISQSLSLSFALEGRSYNNL